MGLKECRVRKFLKLPVRFLARARDSYVAGMTRLSSSVIRYDAVSVIGCPTVPRSFSVPRAASSVDYPELVRAASVRGSFGNRIVDFSNKKKQGRKEEGIFPGKVGRSQSVGLGRIEEERSCHFEDHFVSNNPVGVGAGAGAGVGFSRSRSCAISVGAASAGVFFL